MTTLPFQTWRSLLACAVVLWASPAQAELKVGDAAPALRVEKWVKGGEVREFEGDKVYIVEFWATWCGPCVQAIPHLSQIQGKFKDRGLVVIGMNLGEDAATVSAFAKSMGGKMNYHVAVDAPGANGSGWMAAHWLEAAKQNGIPCGFVIGKNGKIAYIGHPMALKESLLESLLDAPSAKPSTADERKNAGPGEKAAALARRAADELAAGKLDDAEATIVLLNDTLPAEFRYIGGLLDMELLIARKRDGDAVQLSKLIATDYRGQPEVLATVAARLVATKDAGADLQGAAEALATPLSTTKGPAQAGALATLARIAMLRGQAGQAVEFQTKAAALSDTPSAKAALEAYRANRLP